MELGQQIKKYRGELQLSQEELAERVYVSRQTISNWENDKSYPDVKSLVMLSEIFHTSVDTLIKGDLETMKEQIKAEDISNFKRMNTIFSILFICAIVLPIPLYEFLGVVGIILWVILFAVTMYFAIIVEKQKKKFDMQTYKEIVAFYEGKKLDEIDKAREEGKRPYQKVVLAIISGLVTVMFVLIFEFIFLR